MERREASVSLDNHELFLSIEFLVDDEERLLRPVAALHEGEGQLLKRPVLHPVKNLVLPKFGADEVPAKARIEWVKFELVQTRVLDFVMNSHASLPRYYPQHTRSCAVGASYRAVKPQNHLLSRTRKKRVK